LFGVSSSSNARLFTIKSTGNVGIGTSTPATALSVIGTSTTQGLNISNLASAFLAVDASGNVVATTSPTNSQWTSTSTSIYYNGGNVGIGTAAPSQKLDVSGNINLNTNGTSALFSTYKGANSDGLNIWIGGGGQNSVGAIGTTYKGSSNSAIGASALQSNTTGYQNSAIGLNALYANTTGYQNSAIGASALYANTTGYYNSAMGESALYSNTTGYYNSAMGESALYSNTTGYNNSAIGMSTLYSNTTGYYNSAIGRSALYYNTTGTFNSAIGMNAGRYLLDGAAANATGTNSLFLGYDTRANADGQTNQIVVGSSAIGKGSNTAVWGNTSILNHYFTGNVNVTGNIGIGTTSPSAKLDIYGTSSAPTTDLFGVSSSSNARLFTINSAGNVGIGTTTPSSLLTVAGNGYFGGTLTTTGSITAGGNLILGANTLTTSNTGVVTNLNADMIDSVHSTTIYKDGDVIMPTNPFGGRQLFINSTQNAYFRADKRWVVTAKQYKKSDDSLVSTYAASVVGNLFDGNYESTLDIAAGNYAIVNINFSTETNGYYPQYPYGNFYVSHYYTSFPIAAVTNLDTLSVYCNYAPQTVGWKTMSFADFLRTTSLITKASNSYYNISEAEFKIYADDTSLRSITQIDMQLSRPSSNEMPILDKFKTNILYDNLQFESGTSITKVSISPSGNSYFNGGNVGIGTTTPSAKLDIYGTAGSADIFGISSSSNARLFTIKSTGNVGIGTSTPATALSVIGTSTTQGLNISNLASAFLAVDASGNVVATTSPTSSQWISTSTGVYYNGGNVGIGTTAPSQKLDVSGNINLNTNGTSALFSTYKGANSDGLNIWIGGGGQNSVGAIGTTYKGSSNSAIGASALLNNTTGYQNSAIGVNALYSNTTGYANSAIGASALGSNTTGYFNSAIGGYALQLNTTGNYNSAIGGYALLSNTTGYYNSAIGVGALQNNTTGYYNSAIGVGALYTNTTGYENSAIGMYALYTNTTGYYNSAIGRSAGRYLLDGAAANATGNNSLFLGYDTRANADGQTNQIVVGASAIGKGSNTAVWGNTSITDHYFTGNVNVTGNIGIGTTSPSAKLDIYGTSSAPTTDLFGVSSSSNARLFTIKSTGNVGIGTSTPSANLTASGTVRFTSLGSAGATLVTDSLGNVTVSSDERLKNIQNNYERGLADIMKINPIQYKWKEETGYDTENVYSGFSAQNMTLAIPEAVATSSSGYLTIADRPIVAALVNSIKQVGSFITKIAGGIAYLKNIVVETFAVGSEKSPSGITMYDETSGNPYCVKIVKGILVNEDGVCKVSTGLTATVLDAENDKTIERIATSTSDTVLEATSTPETISTSTSETVSTSTIDSNISTTTATSSDITVGVSTTTDSISTTTPETETNNSQSSTTPEIEKVASSTEIISTNATTSAEQISTSTDTSLEQATSTTDTTSNVVPYTEGETSVTTPVEQVIIQGASEAPKENNGDTSGNTNTQTEQNTEVAPVTETPTVVPEATPSEDSQLTASVFGAKLPQGMLLTIVLIVQGLMLVGFIGYVVYNKRKVK